MWWINYTACCIRGISRTRKYGKQKGLCLFLFLFQPQESDSLLLFPSRPPGLCVFLLSMWQNGSKVAVKALKETGSASDLLNSFNRPDWLTDWLTTHPHEVMPFLVKRGTANEWRNLYKSRGFRQNNNIFHNLNNIACFFFLWNEVIHFYCHQTSGDFPLPQ